MAKHAMTSLTYNVPYGFHTVQVIVNAGGNDHNFWVENELKANQFFEIITSAFESLTRNELRDLEYYFLLASDQNLIDNEITLVNSMATFRIIDAMAHVNV